MSYKVLAPIYEQLMDDVLYTIYLDLVLKHTKPCTMIELGCGTAYLSRELTKKDYKVTAVDMNQSMLETAAHYANQEDLTITFYKHNILNPLDETYDLLIMPVDVINHLNNLNEVKTAITHVINAMNKDSIFIFDTLNCQYIESLIGYHEAILIEDYEVEWEVTAVNESCAHEHHLTVNKEKSSHIARGYDESTINQFLEPFNIIDKITLDERTIFVLKQKEK